jgi:hypothetical protein
VSLFHHEHAEDEDCNEKCEKAPEAPKPAPKPKVKVVEKVVEKIVEKVVHPTHPLPAEVSLEEQAKKRNMN